MASPVLISGAGVAGCCLAWWLDRYGYDVTLVETAEAPRSGGYIIDFWGLGFEVAERMGMLSDLKPHDLGIRELRIVDGRGRRTSGFDQAGLRGLTGGRMMSLPRSALALSLFGAIGNRVEVRFGESVTGIEQDKTGVDVHFRSGATGRYDLVFGAGGLHSAVRALVFGPEEHFEHYLGYYAAAFTAPKYPHRDPHVYVMYGQPGREMARITLPGGDSLFLMLFSSDRPLAVGAHDTEAQKAELRRVFACAEWEGAEVLRALDASTDLYFDRMSQIVMPAWSYGRVALLGDACACPSLIAGEGSSMAMVEAYCLAHELRAAAGDYQTAFRAYENRLQPFVSRKQKAARGFASSFIPKSGFGMWMRDTMLNLIGTLGLSRLALRGQLRDSLSLH